MEKITITDEMLKKGKKASAQMSPKAIKALKRFNGKVFEIEVEGEYFPFYGLILPNEEEPKFFDWIHGLGAELETMLEADPTFNATPWTVDSFGSGPIPLNVDDVLNEANLLIDAGADPGELWEAFCETDMVGSVCAYWDEDEKIWAEIVSEGRYLVAVELMDDEIREELHARLAHCSEYKFLREYVLAHKLKFGEDFRLN